MSDVTTMMSPTEYASRLGISCQALRDAARKHHLTWQPGSGPVPVAVTDGEWSRLHRDGKVKTPAPGAAVDLDDDDEDDESLASAKRRKTLAEAQIAEMRLARLQGEMVAVVEVEQTWMRIGGAINGALDSLPARLAGVLPGEPFEVARILRDEIRAVREELSEQVELAAQEAEAETAVKEEDDESKVEPAPEQEKKKGRRRAS